MSELEAGFASFVAKLEQAYPEFRVLRAYLTPSALAAECLLHELAQTVFHVSEPVVAINKLRWWSEELERCVDAAPRHPLTRRLGGVAAEAPQRVRGLAAQAARLHEMAPPADFAAQLQAVEPVFLALEAVAGSDGAGQPPRARLRALGHALRELARLPLADRDNTWALPMQLLARHQLRREELLQPSPARDLAVREQLAGIAAALAELGADAAALGGLGRLRRRCDLYRSRVSTLGDPFPALWQRLNGLPWSLPWLAWREGRRGRV